MTDFLPVEKATPIRMPSTANLMIDSADRSSGSPWKFGITRGNSILNGFFTRIGTTEVVLEWKEGNGLFISNLTIDLSGVGTKTYSTNSETFYTAAALFDNLCAFLNGASGFATANLFQVVQTTGLSYLQTSTNVAFTIASNNLTQWGFEAGDAALDVAAHQIFTPDLRPYRYLDFVSSQLTYNQDLKDSSTATITRDVLCRWYFAFDNEPALDTYGFPILMGYTPFTLRRIFSPPKQIRWSNNQPIGQLYFEVYGDDDDLVADGGFDSNWLMTLQVSEV